MQRALATELRRAGDEAAGQVSDNADIDLSGHADRMEQILRRWWRTIMMQFADRFFASLRRGGILLETKDQESDFERAMRLWIEARAAERVTRISEVTRDQVRRAIAEANAENLGTDETARRIRSKVRSLTPARAAIIARTELHGASNAATVQASEASGLEMRKEWIAAEDARTRPTHDTADGQVVGRDETFQVGVAKLAHPGDPLGPPAEIINCRCVIGWLTE